MSDKTTVFVPRLKAEYAKSLRAKLQKDLDLANINQVPKLEKIVLNIGLGKAKDDKRMFEVAENTLRKITGQQPVVTAAKMSIASFKLREGNKVGIMVTLRGDRMYEFLDRIVNIVLPRLRDFHGISLKAFDKNGNYSFGLKEQAVFPELSYEETAVAHGLQITIVVKCENKEHSKALLKEFGVPFERSEGDK
ncbi:50S ribosomal protein L5 [Candidatus Saccharibacteria bacterium]|nr:50S ribosomal protein L5 [Candidatus Saccharibacteria bacterium]MCB9821545.1 50S ribosomal protein L5 [Candidatus Nomurabacteria bacterium]